MVEKLKRADPQHLFKIPIQAAIGGEDHRPRDHLGPSCKDVTAKCYGGDATRKRKLLEAQKAGKRNAPVREVEILQEAFINARRWTTDLLSHRVARVRLLAML